MHFEQETQRQKMFLLSQNHQPHNSRVSCTLYSVTNSSLIIVSMNNLGILCVLGDAVSPGPRYGHESVVVNNNKLLVWGGRLVEDGRWKVLSRCECFTMDLYSKQWIRINAGIDNKQDEPTPCVHARCAAINSMVYSFGGWYMTDEGKEARLNKVFSLDSDKMRWKKLEKKGNKPTARNSCGLSAAGEKLVMYGGLISHADRSKLPDGAQYKQDNASFGYANDCWEFCPHKGNISCYQFHYRNVMFIHSTYDTK